MNWSPIGDQWYQGRLYGQKDRSFERFCSLPQDTGEAMELALKPPVAIRARLVKAEWQLVNPIKVTLNARAYQCYLRRSRAEFSVAKHGYVISRCGWFSERSAAYLASGRPIVVQDTGFADWLETGAGVLAFSTPEDARAGIEEINSRYEYHCRAARAIAGEYFDAREVLSSLIERAMTDLPASTGKWMEALC